VTVDFPTSGPGACLLLSELPMVVTTWTLAFASAPDIEEEHGHGARVSRTGGATSWSPTDATVVELLGPGHQPLQGTKGFRKALAQGVPGARTEPLVEQDEEPLRLPGKHVSRARTAHVERELSLSV